MDTEMMDTQDVGMNVKKSMKRAGLFFFIILALQLPASLVVGLIARSLPEEYTSLVSILTVQGYLLLSALIYIAVTKSSLSKDMGIRKFKLSSFFLCLILLLTATPMANFLNVVSQLFAKNEVGNAIYDITGVMPGWLAVLMIGCMPGFTEEVIFRGIIHRAFRKRSVLTGVLVSAISFGLMHMNLNQIMYALYLGIIFALVNEATGSLLSTMIMHMIFNGFNTALIFILPKLFDYLAQFSSEYADFDMAASMNQTPDKSMLIMAMGVWAPFAIGGLVITILLLKAIAHINGREFTWASLTRVKEGCEDVKPVNVSIMICWIICLGFALIALFKG